LFFLLYPYCRFDKRRKASYTQRQMSDFSGTHNKALGHGADTTVSEADEVLRVAGVSHCLWNPASDRMNYSKSYLEQVRWDPVLSPPNLGAWLASGLFPPTQALHLEEKLRVLAGGGAGFTEFLEMRLGADLEPVKASALWKEGSSRILLVFQKECRLPGRKKKTSVDNPGQEEELHALQDVFVSMISHEFRTPLAVIQGSAEILANYEDRLNAERKQRHLQNIQDGVLRLAEMMDDVLVLAKLDAGKLVYKAESGNLKEACQNICTHLEQKYRNRCRIRQDLILPEEHHWFDLRYLEHILGNVLSNAMKYSPEGQDVEFHAEDLGRKMVRFVVQDHGIGIPRSEQNRIYESFWRGSNVGNIPGTGIGLMIVRRCVESAGGKMDLSSQEGKGTRVEFTLPFFRV